MTIEKPGGSIWLQSKNLFRKMFLTLAFTGFCSAINISTNNSLMFIFASGESLNWRELLRGQQEVRKVSSSHTDSEDMNEWMDGWEDREKCR